MAVVTAQRRFAIYLLPLLGWMLLIFLLSTDSASAAHTSPVVHSFLAAIPFLRDHLTPAQIGEADHIVRKSAHITEYAILATLMFRALRQDRPNFRDIYVWGTILFCFLYACTDEYHQIFVPSRGPSFGDVMFDTCGGMIGTLINLWRFVRRRKP